MHSQHNATRQKQKRITKSQCSRKLQCWNHSAKRSQELEACVQDRNILHTRCYDLLFCMQLSSQLVYSSSTLFASRRLVVPCASMWQILTTLTATSLTVPLLLHDKTVNLLVNTCMAIVICAVTVLTSPKRVIARLGCSENQPRFTIEQGAR